jgi:histidyl-tRNA synthetase
VITSQKGTRDLLPPETRVWNRVEAVAREVFALYGFDEIRTPVFEATELFVRSVGEGTDIVHKEMYTFTDRGGRSVTLRPENTAGVARAFVEHRLAQAGGVHRLYYLGPQFRYERPQKGRYREFRQIGAEVLGDPTALIDAEVIVMLFDFLARLGFAGPSVSLNSVGTEATRPAYVEAVKAFFSSNEGDLGEDDRRRLAENPMRVLDSKDPAVKQLVASPGFPTMVDLLPKLDPASDAHHRELKALLTARQIPFKEDPLLVRGLDYYTRTVFEVTAQGLGAQDALLGGGRYDRLVSDLGGPKTPGIGFAIGEDRLVDVLPEAFRSAAIGDVRPVAVIPVGAPDAADALALATGLRRAGVAVDLASGHRGLGNSLKAAEKSGARFTLLVGENERLRGTVLVKEMATRTQSEVPREQLVEWLRPRL